MLIILTAPFRIIDSLQTSVSCKQRFNIEKTNRRQVSSADSVQENRVGIGCKL